MISTAAAPSQIWLELPAVTRPSGMKAGASDASFSADVSRLGVSSTPNERSDVRVRHLDRDDLALEAALVDRRDRPAVRLERVRVELLAREAPLLGDHLGRDPLRDDLPALVSFSERSPPFEPIGTRDIISTPAETTTSSCSDQIAAAALKFVCIDEPH